jgi:transposase
VRYLREHDIRVLEVNQPHAHTPRRCSKSDPIDAEMAARLALARKATTIPKRPTASSNRSGSCASPAPAP